MKYSIKESDIRKYVKYIIKEMRAFHGSGARFNRFDSSFNGSGEGSSSFGPGHYFTNSKDIARDYALEHGTSQNEIGKFSYKGVTSPQRVISLIAGRLNSLTKNDNYKVRDIASEMYKNSENANQLIRNITMYAIKCWKENDPNYEEDYEEWYKDSIQHFRNKLKEEIKDINNRSLYQVELPDEDKFADWRMEIPDQWYEFLYKLLDARKDGNMYYEKLNKIINSYIERDGCLTIGTLYYSLNNMHYDATLGDLLFKLLLQRYGYIGVKYPSGTNFQTSSTKQGDMNYTVFKDDDIQMKKRWDL